LVPKLPTGLVTGYTATARWLLTTLPAGLISHPVISITKDP